MTDLSLVTSALLENSPDGIMAFDTECRYTVWNPVMVSISGMQAEHVLGRNAFELFPFLLETGEDRCFTEALAGSTVHSSARPFVVPQTGRAGYFEALYMPLRDPSGMVTGALGIVRDVTTSTELARQRESTAATEAQLQLIVDSVPALISLIGPDLRYRLVNRAYEEWFGLPREEIVGRQVAELLGPAAWEAVRPHMEQALSGKQATYEQHLAVGGQAPRWLSFTYTPRRNQQGEVDGFVTLASDIGARKEEEERQRVLAEATEVLGTTLDYETTLQQVARLALPHLADFCFVDVVEEGEIRRIAVAHVDPEREELLREVQRRFPPTWDSPAPAARVLRSGEPELLPEVDAEVAARHTVSAEHCELIRRLNIRSHMAVPMLVRGEKLGAISLALTRTDRRYGPTDLAMLEELARRAATAVDNARLYRAAQNEIQERIRAEEALKLHSLVLESMREGVSVTDEQGVIVYTNPAEDVTFGYSPGELLGQHVTVQNAYPPEENRRIVDEVIRTLQRDGVWIGEWLNRKKDGTVFTTRAQITALETGERRFWVCVQEDVTAQKRADEAVRRSEERYRSVVAATTSIVWMADPEGRFVEPQASWESYTGQPWEEHRGFGWIQAIHPEDRERLLACWRAAIAETSQYEAYGRAWHGPSGQYRSFVARGVPLLDADGKVREWIGAYTDIHDRVRAEEALVEETRTIETINRVGQVLAGELDLHSLLQAFTDAATEISDAQFGAFFYNVLNERGEAYMLYTLSGVPRSEFERFPMPRNTAIFEPTFRGEGAVRLDDVTQDPRYGKNPPYHGMPEGHLPVRSYLALPVSSRTGEVLGGLFFGHERTGVFTERHERILVGIAAQAAIAIDNARLYKQAREAEYAFRERAEALAEANRQKDAFLAMLAHELRNPLGAISNSLHVMSLSSPEQPAFRRAQEVAARQINHQTRLVDDLLDVSRIERGKIQLHLEDLDLAALVRETAEDHRTALEGAGVALLLELPKVPVRVRGDRVRLAQVIGNLLDNARKFTPAGGRVNVHLALTHAREAVLTLRDNGIGIDPEVLPHLFTPFAQADRTLDRSQGGLGLGLALVKGLVELHAGGTVRVASGGAGQGAEFTITLPAELAPMASPSAAPTAATAAGAVRVLVIEDIRDAAETLRDLLELLGCEVSIAYSGFEGVRKAGELRPDIILCDIGLPGMDGYEVARQVRAAQGEGSAGSSDPGRAFLVALTGYGAEEDLRRSRDAGFDLHLVKPLQPGDLQRILLNAGDRAADAER